MDRPPRDLSPDDRLRHEVAALLQGRQAHVDAHRALDGIPGDRVNERPEGTQHSLYDLVEHLTRAQADILEYATDPGYRAKAWPADYWPRKPATPADWTRASEGFVADLDELIDLAETGELFDELPWAPGYTLLRQLMLAADHNAYHLGQVVALRQRLGLWPPPGR
ncbi:DinB family protein [Rubrivirga sp. IMCC45206]|uniref:DinB family protein n=1 Tax=Rubrivirga sp. IMCC45206 TaxID=3391614 RepID=UPI00398FF27F